MRKLLEKVALFWCGTSPSGAKPRSWWKNVERGAVSIGSTLMMGVGMVFLAVGFIMFPIVTDATDDLLGWAYSGNATITDASFTGFTSVIGITPLLVLLGFITASVISMWLGVSVAQGEGAAKFDLGGLLMVGISIVFIAVGLIILPVSLDGIASVIHGGGAGISSSYTGLSAVLLVTPLLILISFLSGSVLSGFFGIKKLGSGMND